MNLNVKHSEHSTADQEVLPFTGEGAYHGSTKRRDQPNTPRPPPPPEMQPRTVEAYEADGRTEIAVFRAEFPNLYEVLETLPVPSQEAIRDDGVTFCWCPFEQAVREAGPLVRSVLEAMRPHLDGTRQFTYIDAKIQYFEAGDLPVDSQHWHLDGTIVARGPFVESLGHPLLHDMRARMDGAVRPPIGLSYQSSSHCATRFVTEPTALDLPELIPNFDGLDAKVRELAPRSVPQPAASIVRFDGLSLHRADVAIDSGWRLWVRCFETDREVRLSSTIIDCYGTVFRT